MENVTDRSFLRAVGFWFPFLHLWLGIWHNIRGIAPYFCSLDSVRCLYCSGTGASCIFPLLGVRTCPSWGFVATGMWKFSSVPQVSVCSSSTPAKGCVAYLTRVKHVIDWSHIRVNIFHVYHKKIRSNVMPDVLDMAFENTILKVV